MILLLAFLAHAHVHHQDPNKATDWTRDLDRDGVIDALDWDRDGDGVGNAVDVAPDDSREVGGDHDRDGIPDVADWDRDFPRRSPEMCVRQAKIFAQTGVMFLMIPLNSFTREFLDGALKMLLEYGPRADEGGPVDWREHLRYVKLDSDPSGALPTDQALENLGSYDPNQKLIRLKPIPIGVRRWIEATQYVWAHELAHVLQKSQPALYHAFLAQSGWSVSDTLLGPYWTFQRGSTLETFLQSEFQIEPDRAQASLAGDDFVSELAKLGGEEMFAESWAAEWLRQTDGVREWAKADFASEWKLNSRFEGTPLSQLLSAYFKSASR